MHSTSLQGLPHTVHAQNYVTPTGMSLCFFQQLIVPSSLQFVRHVNKLHVYKHMSCSLNIIKQSQPFCVSFSYRSSHVWLSDASCLHATMPSHAPSQVVRKESKSEALTMTSALQAVEEREPRNSDAIEPQGQFQVKWIYKRDF